MSPPGAEAMEPLPELYAIFQGEVCEHSAGKQRKMWLCSLLLLRYCTASLYLLTQQTALLWPLGLSRFSSFALFPAAEENLPLAIFIHCAFSLLFLGEVQAD